MWYSMTILLDSAADFDDRDPDSTDDEPANTRQLTVTADDGVQLYVEVDEAHAGRADGANLTVVFCHGYLLGLKSWYFQRRALGGRVRAVLWDQRGHGRSGWGNPVNATIDQLGRDLFAVLQKTAPTGPVVLVGHSMGAMTILDLAAAHPELFGDRVVAVLLCGASAGGLSDVTAGLPTPVAQVLHRVIPASLSTLRQQPRLVDAIRRRAGVPSMLLTRSFLFASSVPAFVASLTTRLMASTPILSVAEFWKELVAFDAYAVLPVLGQVPTRLLVGTHDRLTPRQHSEAIAAAIPGAELVVVPSAAHMVMLECPDEVNKHMWELIHGAHRPRQRASNRSPTAGAKFRSTARRRR